MFSRRVCSLVRFVCVISLLLPCLRHTSALPVLANGQEIAGSKAWIPASSDDAFVYQLDNDQAVCRPASREEALSFSHRDPGLEVHRITPEGVREEAAGEITILLRGTAQLLDFPEATQGFLRAAERWQAVIQAHAPITIIIDVDFGPTRFGTPFGTNVLGATATQSLFNANAYPAVRAGLLARADGAQETTLYNALPASPAPTDLGSTAGMVVQSALLRALGEIPAVADPANEPGFGSPPSVGFNSSFQFDFNPNDGIDSNKIDFDSVATHELGHALGFGSRVGSTELDATAPVTLTLLDLFRFRPGTTLGTFPTAQRIESSGGTQVFFAGASDVELSTGRPNATGGDGFQASHWKNMPAGLALGIMDPAIAFGERQVIGANDKAAFDAFGYLLRDTSATPTINSLSASLSGDVVTLTGQAVDPQGDITQAETALLDGNLALVQQNSAVAANLGGQTPVNFTLPVTGLSNVPGATRVRLVLIDRLGNRSPGFSADFSAGDPGGPNISLAFYGPRLVVRGSGLTGTIQVEVNGLMVGTKQNESNKKLKLGGSVQDFNIRTGTNRVRVINGNLRSNLFVGALQ